MNRFCPSSSLPRRALAAILALAAGSASASGFPDPSFDGDGVYLSPLSGNQGPNDGLIDDQGRYVAVGSRVGAPASGSFVFRIRPDGQPDPTFNGTGDVHVLPPAGYDAVVFTAVAQQPDGKLVVAGRVGPNFINDDAALPYVCRLLATGAFDPGFGAGGCTVEPYVAGSTRASVADIALQADGRIVVLGSSTVGSSNPALLRLNIDGSRDLCFNDATCTAGGSVYDPVVGAEVTSVSALAIGANGRIVFVGSATGPQSIDMVAVRLLPSGAVDAGFGNVGSRTVAFELGGGNRDFAHGVAVLDDLSIVIAGNADYGVFLSLAAVAKLTPGGTLDVFFGQTGTGRSWTFYNDVSIHNTGNDVAIQADGKIVVGGTSYLGLNSTDADFAAWRLLPNGMDDASFGFDGRISVTTSDDPENLQVVQAVGVDERHILLFGHRRPNNQSSLKTAFVRLEQDRVLADGFESD